MKRKYRYGGGVDIAHSRQFDKMKIQPPVFASVADAYLHMVRHPEEMEVTENDEGYIPVYNSTDDFFDRAYELNEWLQNHNPRIGENLDRMSDVLQGDSVGVHDETDGSSDDSSGDPTPE